MQDGPRSVRLNMYGIEAVLECDEDVEVPPAGEGANAVVGVRPEFMTVSEKGEGVAGKVYSTLPSGMETTVKIHYGDQIFTSVVFGGVDYAVNQPIHFSFRGKDILLFGKESGKRIGVRGDQAALNRLADRPAARKASLPRGFIALYYIIRKGARRALSLSAIFSCKKIKKTADFI